MSECETQSCTSGLALLSSFTEASQGVHALSGNGTNKRRASGSSILGLVYVIFLSFFQADLL